MKKHTRRWWLIVVIIVIAAVAATTAAYLLVFRDKSASVHYLTSTAATGTIAKTVQADFTLTDSRDAMTISLSGTGSSSSSSNSNGAAATTSASSSPVITTVSAILPAAGAVGAPATSRATSSATSAVPALASFTPTSGPVGTSVTLTGSGLSGTSAVSFNGQTAYFKVESDSQVAAIVPTGATSGPITVTTGDGTAASTDPFTVTPTPKPTPSRTATASPRPAASRSASSRSGGSSAGSGGSSTGSGTSLTASSSSSSASSSSSTSGVVTRIVLPSGSTPTTLQPLMAISSKPIFAFVSATPLYKTLSTSLSSGDERANVAVLQRALKARGYFSGTVNGDFGTTTQTALEDWQSAHGLTQTGEITTSDFVWVPSGAAIESWNVVLGGVVSSTTALATVDFPRLLVAEADVTQADVSSLKVGQKATLTIDGETSDPFTGTITAIASQPASSSSAGSSSSAVEYTVDLVPKSLPTLAKSGMTGSLTVTIAKRSNVLVVPTSAVSGTSSASFVRVMMNGVPSYRQVTTGMATSSLTQITSGLTAGEVVVTGTYTNSANSSSSTTTGGFGGFGGGSFRRSSSGGGTFFGGGSSGSGQ